LAKLGARPASRGALGAVEQSLLGSARPPTGGQPGRPPSAGGSAPLVPIYRDGAVDVDEGEEEAAEGQDAAMPVGPAGGGPAATAAAGRDGRGVLVRDILEAEQQLKVGRASGWLLGGAAVLLIAGWAIHRGARWLAEGRFGSNPSGMTRALP
jgi:hypothetical protein